MKPTRSLCLSLVLALAAASPAAADHVAPRPLTTACPANQVSGNPFADVAQDSAFELPTSCLADYGITRGRTPTSYDLRGSVSRQQMAQFLHRLGSGAGVSWDTSDAGFEDLDDVSAEARDAINALANAGVAQGRSDERFDPYGEVTRAQMASFLARLAEVAGAPGFVAQGNAFDDDEGLGHEENIERIAAARVTTGRSSARMFDPLSAVTREQMAAFLARTLDVFVAQGLTVSRFRSDVAPATVALDQDGQLVSPGSALTGRISGDRIRSAGLASSCGGSMIPAGGAFSVPTDPQAAQGPCPVSVGVTYDNGRTATSEHRVALPGYVDRPELVDVVPVDSAPDGITSRVRFRFDEPVRVETTGDARPGFTLHGYAGELYASTEVQQDGSTDVVATFGTESAPLGAEELHLIGHASGGGVVGLDGQSSVGGEVVLDPGSTSRGRYGGPTPSADLLTVTPSRTSDAEDAFDFTFDARLPQPVFHEYDNGSGSGEHHFEVLLTAGISVPCTAPDHAPLRQVTVVCAGVDPEQVARGLVSYRRTDNSTGATTDSPRYVSLLRDQPTVAPDLVAVEPGPRPDQITAVFDEPVILREQRFHVGEMYSEMGIRAEPSQDDPTRVVLNGEGHGQTYSLEHVRLVTARGGAVVSRATGLANVVDQAWMQSKPMPDRSAGGGAILLRVEVDEQAEAHFVFAQYMPLDDELGQRHWGHTTFLKDGTRLTCTMGYEREGSPYPAHTTNRCFDFRVIDDSYAVQRPATAEEVRGLTLGVVGYGSDVDAVPVGGVRR